MNVRVIVWGICVQVFLHLRGRECVRMCVCARECEYVCAYVFASVRVLVYVCA